MDLFLIRHAQSANNALPESQRVPDPALTELGREQAHLLGKWLPELGITRLITSPFLRTLQTTALIHDAAGLVPEVRTPLHEKGGCYLGYEPERLQGQPGMTRLEIEEAFRNFRVADDIDHQGWWKGRPYESHAEAVKRAELLLRTTIEEFGQSEERVAYVMHADIKVLFLEHFHAKPLGCPSNACVTHVTIQGDRAVLADFNRTEHLGESLISR